MNEYESFEMFLRKLGRNPFFAASGFSQQEAIGILEGRRDQIDGLKAKRERLKAEKKRINRVRLVYNFPRKPGSNRRGAKDVSAQIQRGFDTAARWANAED